MKMFILSLVFFLKVSNAAPFLFGNPNIEFFADYLWCYYYSWKNLKHITIHVGDVEYGSFLKKKNLILKAATLTFVIPFYLCSKALYAMYRISVERELEVEVPSTIKGQHTFIIKVS